MLLKLRDRNPSGIHLDRWTQTPGSDSFVLSLLNTTGLRRDRGGIVPVESHEIEYRFARFFPAVPVEAWLKQAILHPNVDEATGFVCLWGEHSPGTSIIEATRLLQSMISFAVWNSESPHVMQLDALAWIETQTTYTLPLPTVHLIDPIQHFSPDRCRAKARASRKRLFDVD